MSTRPIHIPKLGMKPGEATDAKVRPYACYALFILIAANFLNYLDRNMIGVLTQSIQRDLKFTDAEMGFILGTSFAVLFGILGIPMGRIADALSRTRLMALGLAVWSVMTALSGGATSFASLALARVGVGLGEATANPCSHSLISSYFPPKNRSTVFSIYVTSIYLGSGASLILGGFFLQDWSTICQAFPGNACSIADWRAALFAVGIPGLLLAVVVAFLREPPRPEPAKAVKPLQLILREISTAIPPFTLFHLHKLGNWAAVGRNLALAASIFVAGVSVAYMTGDWPQWIAVTIGAYSITTWAQALSRVDRPLFDATFGSSVFMLTVLSGALIGCFVGTITVWSAPYAMRELAAKPGELGLLLGVTQILSAGLSVVIGGMVTDRWKRRDRRAPIWIGLIALLGPIPWLVVMLHTESLTIFVVGFGFLNLLGMCWVGAFAALLQDIVQVRMRGTATAISSLTMILIGSGLGPYWAGKISTLTGSLTLGLYSLLALVPVAAILLLMAAARLRRASVQIA